MNEILAKFEELSTSDLLFIFEYLIELINERKRIEAKEKKKKEFECKQRNLKQ